MTASDLLKLQRPQIPSPGWDEAEGAIRTIGCAEAPLFTFAPQGTTGADGYLTVQGHFGKYTLTATFPGYGRFRYTGPPGDGEDVEIHNDGQLQDFVDERYVCQDLEFVLGVARHFWEFGELHPSVTWERA